MNEDGPRGARGGTRRTLEEQIVKLQLRIIAVLLVPLTLLLLRRYNLL